MAFLVTNIIDANTFQVRSWKLGQQAEGSKVRILGTIKPNDVTYNTIATNRLKNLIENKEVELLAPSRVEKDASGETILICRVVLNNVDIINYFPEMKQQQA